MDPNKTTISWLETAMCSSAAATRGHIVTVMHSKGFENVVLEHPPILLYPNKDLPLSKDKIRAAHKEPVWKSGRVNEKES